MFLHFLFPYYPSSIGHSLVLLVARICLGLMFLRHGVEKWLSFGTLSTSFPDPLYVGPTWSLIMTIVAEVVCSIFFIFGFLYRLVLLPMIFAMGMAFFVIHDGSLDGGELSLFYLIAFVLMYLTGPGRFSFDSWLGHQLVV